MKYITNIVAMISGIALIPATAFSAGTYYNGAYQSPQQRYSQPVYQNTGYTGQQNTTQQRAAYNQSAYPQYSQNGQPQTAQKTNSAPASANKKNGFYLDGGISRETAMWQFDLKESGSSLHYDNVSWNVFDANAGYVFNAGNTPMQITAGLKFGMQAGDTTMVDDDITNGGYFETQWVDDSNSVIGNQIGHALSIGTSSGGSMFGYNVAFGLTDFFTLGKTKITPSVGYRSLSYKLETSQNYGLAVDTAACFMIDGEEQCDPAVIINFANGSQQILWRDEITDSMQIGSGASNADTGGTYYFRQPGTSHSYEVDWSGPYVAMDMEYAINNNNLVNARAELGIPGYTATGDQPYRFDWAHPKSVEDSAGMGSAVHFGMGANWMTALSDYIMLSFGFTYDYYSVSGANAKTYLNESYYNNLYNDLLTIKWLGDETAMLNETTGDPIALNIKDIESSCPGWVCNADSEVDSFYKSMGIRVGLNAKF